MQWVIHLEHESLNVQFLIAEIDFYVQFFFLFLSNRSDMTVLYYSVQLSQPLDYLYWVSGPTYTKFSKEILVILKCNLSPSTSS